MSKQIIVRVHDDGTVDAETIGMHGAECLDYFAVLEDLLEAETVSSSYTEDYHRTGAETGTRAAQASTDAVADGA